MAIGITGTNVIDNFRNLININSFSPGNILKTGVGGALRFTNPGTFVIGTNTPTGITSVKILACGGGGRGGGTPGQNDSSGSGGGGGAQAQVAYMQVTNGESFTITIGGAGGSSLVTKPSSSAPTIRQVFASGGNAPNVGPAFVPAGSFGAAGVTSTTALYTYGTVNGNPGNPGEPNANPNGGNNGGAGTGGYNTLFGQQGYGAGGAGQPGAGPITGPAGQPGVIIFEW